MKASAPAAAAARAPAARMRRRRGATPPFTGDGCTGDLSSRRRGDGFVTLVLGRARRALKRRRRGGASPAWGVLPGCLEPFEATSHSRRDGSRGRSLWGAPSGQGSVRAVTPSSNRSRSPGPRAGQLGERRRSWGHPTQRGVAPTVLVRSRWRDGRRRAGYLSCRLDGRGRRRPWVRPSPGRAPPRGEVRGPARGSRHGHSRLPPRQPATALPGGLDHPGACFRDRPPPRQGRGLEGTGRRLG